MNRILMTAAIAVLFAAAPALAQQNMIDPLYTTPTPPSNGVFYMNPHFDHSNGYTGPSESNRSHVSAVQAELQARGYKIKIDGDYGPKTRAAVKRFQRAKGLRVDGQIGPQTLGALGLSIH